MTSLPSGPNRSSTRRVLIHRYDNELDILAIEERGYSDVYRRAASDEFTMVAVVPTRSAKSNLAVIADARSPQYRPDGGVPWPGRDDRYLVRVDVDNVRYTTLDLVRAAVINAGVAWAAQWTVRLVNLDVSWLFGDAQLLERSPRERVGEGPSLPGELPSQQLYPEGAVRRVLVNAYERNPSARRRCIEYYGATCSICEFNFKSVYGDAAEGFIHVHHLKPLAEIGGSYRVDPIKDLRPLCPNCHAVIHLRTPAYTIEEVRAMRVRT